MGASRTSQKDILNAIQAQTDTIAALAEAIAVLYTPAPAAPVAATAAPAEHNGEIEVNKDYLANRKVAAQEHANKVSAEVVLYARRNLRNETKLAFAQRGRFDTLRDKGLIGPVATFQPE